MDVNHNNLSQTCYDGTWALAMALNRTIQGIVMHINLKHVYSECQLSKLFEDL